MTCHSGIGADNLHRHLNHDLKQLGLSVSRNYCTSIVTKYSLLPHSKLIPPTSIILAIYGLPIESNMQYCRFQASIKLTSEHTLVDYLDQSTGAVYQRRIPVEYYQYLIQI